MDRPADLPGEGGADADGEEDPENNENLTDGVMFAYYKDKTVVFDLPAALKRAKKVAPALVKTVTTWVHKTKFETWAKGLLTSDPERAKKFVRVVQNAQITFKKSLLDGLLSHPVEEGELPF